MANLLTEQQKNQFRSWWHRYGRILTLLLVIIIISFGVWHFHSQRAIKKANNASQLYHRLQTAHDQNNQKRMEKLSKRLKTHYPTTIYAQLADMILARIQVDRENYQQALNNLQQLINQANQQNYFVQLARIRAARLHNHLQQYQKAIDVLDQVTSQTLKPWSALVKAQAYEALNQTDKASKLYQWANQHLQNGSNADSVLKRMTRSIKSSAQSQDKEHTKD